MVDTDDSDDDSDMDGDSDNEAPSGPGNSKHKQNHVLKKKTVRNTIYIQYSMDWVPI